MPKYRVPIWWYELHGDTVEIEADSEEEASHIADSIAETLGDHGYMFSNTFCEKTDYGTDEPEEIHDEL